MPRYKKTDRQEIREHNRKLLLGAAAQEFAQKSYHAANTNRISQAAGFAAGTIFNYFPTKKDLMLALLTETAQVHYDFMSVAVHQVEEPQRRLEVFFEAGFEFITQNLASAQMMINIRYGANEEFKQHLYAGYQPMFQLVMDEILTPGIQQDVFRPVDLMATTNLLMVIYLGTASQITDTGEFHLSAAQVADFATHAILKTGA